MYVSNLDCPWHMTPFPIQGFYIDSEQDVTALAGFCKFVFIDTLRSKSPQSYKQKEAKPQNSRADTKKNANADSANTQPRRKKILVRRPVKYEIKVPFKKELKKAQSIYRDLDRTVTVMATQLQNRTEVDIASAVENTKLAVASVIRNPDAMIWVTKMKREGTPLYQHAINCAIWAAILGREIGLSEPKLETLATGVVLCKVGLFMLPTSPNTSTEFSGTRENPLYKKHVTLALKLLSQSKSLSKEVINTIATHEERFNGSGFPQQLKDTEIPLFGQIAGLVDYYETSVSSQLNAKPLSPSDALSAMYQERDHLFESELIESFIQALGLFPPGTIVKLNNQQIGVVTSNQKNKRLQPEIVMVLDANQTAVKHRILDLHAYNQNICDEPLEIECCLPAGSYDIDISTLYRKAPSFLSNLFS
ncbi:hypothetical protein A9Q81_04385 [Gammaproteobacteria bacterium 42_54_T18]|nr:hypothetical protein A9Q81_04385 [Gammaproteobacteria bacterium 42_54_T18]